MHDNNYNSNHDFNNDSFFQILNRSDSVKIYIYLLL